MKKAPYEFVHDLLSFIHQHYPTLLTFILCHQEDNLNHPLFYRIEENQINLENFMEFIRLVPEKYQYELLTCVTKDGFSLLASAVIYERHEQVKVLIVNLIQHYHKDYAEDLVYFFYGQLQKLNQRPKKIKFIFEQLLEDESIEIQHIKQRFLCNLLNVIIAQASKNPSLNFGRVFKRLFQHSPSEKNRLFLSMLFACCMEHTEQQTKLFIDEILNVLNRLSFQKQSHVIPYLFL
jgi:hypothetical protein